jgi:hypothetical protein
MINNFYLEDFYAFSSYVAGACTYGSDDTSRENPQVLSEGEQQLLFEESRPKERRKMVITEGLQIRMDQLR